MNNINLTSEDIDKYVKEAIVKSLIGDSLSKTIQNMLVGFDNPIERALKPIIQNIAYEIIMDNFEPQIREQLTKIIAESVTTEMTASVVKASAKNLIKAMGKIGDYE